MLKRDVKIMGVYLDYNASAPIDERVLEHMINVYRNNIGNADSRTHDYGNSARKIVENARTQVASILNITKDEVFFTSGATESNNIVIQGLRKYGEETGKRHIITTSIEHKAVLEAAKSLENYGFEVELINPDVSGRVSAELIESRVREDTLLVSVMHVNNETGIIQPVKEIGDFLSNKSAFFHVDATQSFEKLVNELREIRYDMLSMSAHKLCGPQGIGALILRKKRYKLPPVRNITYGGQQEHGLRPGTIPVALVAGLGEACRIAEQEYQSNAIVFGNIKKQLVKLLRESGLSYEINGDQEYCIDSTINVSINGVSSEALMLAAKQYCGVSNGSACNSNSYNLSYVLKAMNIDEDKIKSSIRVSWGAGADEKQIVKEFARLLEIARSLIF